MLIRPHPKVTFLWPVHAWQEFIIFLLKGQKGWERKRTCFVQDLDAGDEPPLCTPHRLHSMTLHFLDQQHLVNTKIKCFYCICLLHSFWLYYMIGEHLGTFIQVMTYLGVFHSKHSLCLWPSLKHTEKKVYQPTNPSEFKLLKLISNHWMCSWIFWFLIKSIDSHYVKYTLLD